MPFVDGFCRDIDFGRRAAVFERGQVARVQPPGNKWEGAKSAGFDKCAGRRASTRREIIRTNDNATVNTRETIKARPAASINSRTVVHRRTQMASRCCTQRDAIIARE